VEEHGFECGFALGGFKILFSSFGVPFICVNFKENQFERSEWCSRSNFIAIVPFQPLFVIGAISGINEVFIFAFDYLHMVVVHCEVNF